MGENMNDYFEFLEGLRESGKTNMLGATAFLLKAFPELTKSEACKILIEWINSVVEKS